MPVRCRSSCSGRMTDRPQCRSSDLHQHRAVPAAVGQTRLQARRRPWVQPSELGQPAARGGHGHGVCRTSSRANAAGFINKAFDLQFLDSMETNPHGSRSSATWNWLGKPTQGVELLNWLGMRAALSVAGAGVKEVHSNYHIPISNTATGVLMLETV